MPVEVETVVDGRMHCGELLETSKAPELQHRTLSSSERQVRVFNLIVQIASGLLFAVVADVLHRRAV